MKRILTILSIIIIMCCSCGSNQLDQNKIQETIGKDEKYLKDNWGKIDYRLYHGNYNSEGEKYLYIGYDLGSNMIVFKLGYSEKKSYPTVQDFYFSKYTKDINKSDVLGKNQQEIIKKYGEPFSKGYVQESINGDWIYQFLYIAQKTWNWSKLKFVSSGYVSLIKFDNKFIATNAKVVYISSP